MGLGGGWPLNVFLTPELKPFFGGTYFPPERRSRAGPACSRCCRASHEAWREQRARRSRSAARLGAREPAARRRRRAGAGAPRRARRCSTSALRARSRARYDREHGGFGGAPKFPPAVEPRLPAALLARATGDATRGARDGRCASSTPCARAASTTSSAAASTATRPTRDWLVPHFEKMLYDQAQLAWAYLDALPGHAASAAYAATARDILDYVLRDLTSPEGAFYSAEDADSEGEEGRFYVWTPAEIARRARRRGRRALRTALRRDARGQLRARHEHPARGAITLDGDGAPPSGSRGRGAEHRLDAARARGCSRRARSARARIATTRCSRRGTGS